MPSIKSKREIREYTRAIEWIRDCLGVEPDELMRTLTGYQPSVKEASEAVTLLVELIANEEPSTLDQLCNDYKFGKSKMIGWEKLLDLMKNIDPAWCKAHDRLRELINSENNSPINPRENIHNESIEKYNSDQKEIYKYLESKNADYKSAHYRFNRAVLFNSSLFHETEEIDFKNEYVGRRINVTYLFGHK